MLEQLALEEQAAVDCTCRKIFTSKRCPEARGHFDELCLGGSTIFTKDTTKFTPKQGDFLFFGYKSDPKYMSMHAACPVLRGVKSTATQWYREGVSKDFTWEDVSDLGYRRTSEL